MRERSLWEATAPPAPDAPPLADRVEADVCIVGAGYSGLSTALHLAEMGRSVVVLEADAPGAGGSGRSGGQVIPGLKHLLSDVVKDYGPDLGPRLHAFGATTADATFDLIRRHGIACDAHRGGWIQAAETEDELRAGAVRAAFWAERGIAARTLDRSSFRAMTGTDAYIGGWLDERGGSLQPLAYVRGLAAAAQRAGVRLYCRSRATAVERQGEGWRVTTARGAVTAHRVLLATNALTGALAPTVQRSQLVVRSFQVATRPLGAAERARVLPAAPIVSDTRRVLRYFRVDRDHRLVIGGKGTLRAPQGPASFALQREMLATLYPDLADVAVEYYWGGQIGITLDRLPRLYVLGDGLLAVLQDNGKGVAWCTATGAILAEALTGKPLDTLPLPPATPPQPIPLHALESVYKAAGGAWYRFRDRLDHALARRP